MGDFFSSYGKCLTITDLFEGLWLVGTFSALAPVLGPSPKNWLCHPHPLFMAFSMIPNNMWHSGCCIACGINGWRSLGFYAWINSCYRICIHVCVVGIVGYTVDLYLVCTCTSMDYMTTWGIEKKKKERHVIEHTSWNMVHGVTHDYMVLIAVYAAERQDLRSSWWRREAWDAINSGSRVDDEKTKYVNMDGLALRELCVGFCLHYRLSYRLSTFWCFDTITIIIVIVIVIDGFLGWSYRNVICFDSQH